MSSAAVLSIASIIIQVCLSIVVLVKNIHRAENKLFALLLVLFALLSASELYIMRGGDLLTGIKLIISIAFCLCCCFCFFTGIYPEYQPDSIILKSKLNSCLVFVPAAVMLALLLSNELVKNDYQLLANAFSISFGSYEFWFKGALISYLCVSLLNLSHSREKAKTTIQKRRLSYTFVAMLLPVAGGSVIAALSRLIMGGTTVYFFGIFPFLSIIMSVILGYTMLKYNLMEIDLIFSAGLVYTLLTAIMAGVMELLQELAQNIFEFSDTAGKIIAILAIAAIFSPLKDFLCRCVDALFGKKSFDSAGAVSSILKAIRQERSQNKVFVHFLRELKLAVGFSLAEIILKDGDIFCSPPNEAAKITALPAFDALGLEINEISEMTEYFTQNKNAEAKNTCEALKEQGVRHYFNIKGEEGCRGALLLWAKSSNIAFTEDELSFVKCLISELTPVLDNLQTVSKMLEQEKSINEIAQAKNMLNSISSSRPDRFNELEIASFSILAPSIKGDMIDVCQNSSAQGSFIGIYDAFHSGLRAVLTLNIIFSVFRCFSNSQSRLENANRVLRLFSQKLGSAITLIDTKDKNISIINAGNPSPLLLSYNGAKTIFSEESKPIGLTSKISVCTREVKLKKNELLFCSTNGLYKAYKKLYSKDLTKAFKSFKFCSSKDCAEQIIKTISPLLGGGFDDDITFIVIG